MMAMSAVERREKIADTFVGNSRFQKQRRGRKGAFRESLQGEKGQRKRKGRKAGKDLPPMRCSTLWTKSLLLAEHGKLVPQRRTRMELC